jgi:N-formylglutamate amidohydrolase
MALSDLEILESTDIGTRELFGQIPARDVLCAQWNRLLVDLNRAPHERGPKGLVALVDYEGRTVYRPGGNPGPGEILRRIQEIHRPYHDRVRRAVSDAKIRALFDCHSLNPLGPKEAPDPGRRRKDVVLGNNGDREGNETEARGRITCPVQTLHLIRDAFEKTGFSVSLNDPYAGGFITTCYGPEMVRRGQVAVQIEINQGLYLPSSGIRPEPARLRDVRSRVLGAFHEIARRLEERA